jgi:hypothetical protein
LELRFESKATALLHCNALCSSHAVPHEPCAMPSRPACVRSYSRKSQLLSLARGSRHGRHTSFLDPDRTPRYRGITTIAGAAIRNMIVGLAIWPCYCRLTEAAQLLSRKNDRFSSFLDGNAVDLDRGTITWWTCKKNRKLHRKPGYDQFRSIR